MTYSRLLLNHSAEDAQLHSDPYTLLALVGGTSLGALWSAQAAPFLRDASSWDTWGIPKP